MVLQNVLAHKIRIGNHDRILPIDNQVLINKMVNHLFVFNASGDYSFYNPDNPGERILPSNEAYLISPYINLFDEKDNQIITNLPVELVTKKVEHWAPSCFIPVNSKINTRKSNITIKTDAQNIAQIFMLYMVYQTKPYKPKNNQINGAITITLPPSDEPVNLTLKSLIDGTLRNKPIKQIISNMNTDNTDDCYIDIFGINGERIQNFPLVLFSNRSLSQFLLDNIIIDFDKTTIKNHFKDAGAGQTDITFIY